MVGRWCAAARRDCDPVETGAEIKGCSASTSDMILASGSRAWSATAASIRLRSSNGRRIAAIFSVAVALPARFSVASCILGFPVARD